jgi:formamidopyrimidine-DNA glycosylase
MPELPEVETVARGLRAVLPGRRILNVRLGKTDFIDDPAAIERDLPGSRVTGIRRFGKFLVVDLESSNGTAHDRSLLIHLGMTGRIVACGPQAPVLPHTHVFLGLDNGRELRYTDIRRFGRMAIVEGGEREKILGPLGPEPLEATEEEFAEKLAGRRARIKSLLLDQTVLRGVGNIYADESLFRAGIHPMRMGASLKREEIHRLRRAVQRVLTEAIRLGGSTVSDYVDSDGLPGEFQLRHRVYQRQGKKCMRCGEKIRRATVAGRSSHFCPKCQPAPQTRSKPPHGQKISASRRSPRRREGQTRRHR